MMGSSFIGVHGLVFTGVFDRSGIQQTVERASRSGFDLLEFPLMEPDSFDAPFAREAIDAADMLVTASLGLPANCDISSSDLSVVAAGVRLLNVALDRAVEMKASHLCGVLFGSMQKHMAPMTPAGRANSAAAIADLAARASEVGIILGLEVVNRYESNLLNTGRQARAFVDEVGRSDVSIHLDTYHMNIEESDLFQPFLDTADRLGYVHIGESHRGYLGTGTVDFSSAFRALRRINYSGPIVFESFSSAVVSASLSNTLGIWRNLWDDSEDLAAHANRFIRDHLRAVSTIDLH